MERHITEVDLSKLPKGWTVHRRNSDIKGWIVEFICPHQIGHDEGVHGCDGCCSQIKELLK